MMGLWATIQNLKRKCIVDGKTVTTIRTCKSLKKNKLSKKN